MPAPRFSRYVLRTTDAPSATAFYDAALGHHGDHVFPLHEQALARGARPHWLGQIDVPDPAAAAAHLIAAGAQQLGQGPGGAIVLRDPSGALVALGLVSAPSTARVVWHVLRARDVENVARLYVELFGWSLGEPVERSNGETYRALMWEAGEPSAGAMGETTEGVHPQWLFFFGVDSLATAIAKVRTHGGVAIQADASQDGTSYAVCEDPQGAAFGLMETTSFQR
jgi:uncharacterized protein